MKTATDLSPYACLRISVFALLLLSGCASSVRYSTGPDAAPRRRQSGRTQAAGVFTGVASYYGPGFHGKQTANGERFDMHAMSAAHKTLPFNTRLRVTNLENGKSVTVRINDRGPFVHGRVLDLSQGAAKAIDMIGSGIARVRCEVLR